MYTLLIVDDEEIEREGMAQFIPWDSYEIKVVSTARNGAEGLEKIAKFRPDLAIVDIKMPVMNGIEMIRQAKEQYPDMTFVVLSGYGDYEFTSQAMELGVRHYILKPCDESKMIPVLNKAFAELEEARKKNARSEKLETEARLLKPYAREQLFRDLLLGKAQASSGARQLVDELGGEQRMVLLLDFRLKCGFDSLERYVVGNMLGDLLPDGTLLMTTGVDRDVLVLADAMAESSVETAVQVLKKEFKRFETLPMLSSASRTGTLAELSVLFRQAQELLQLNMDENEPALLRPSRNAALPETVNEIFDLGDDYFGGYFSDTKITDIDEKYIGSVIDLESLTKISRQLDVSMGDMMGMMYGFAVIIFLVVIYLLSKVIIEKNAQAISMTKILGYTDGEISRLYILSTSLVVVICLLLSLPIERQVMEVLFREMMLASISGWITMWVDPMIYVKMMAIGIASYAVVAALEFRRIRHVPMDEALKNVE